MNKILLISQYFYPEMISTGHILTELLLELSARGLKSSVICAQPTYYSRERVRPIINHQGIDIIRTSNTQYEKNSIKGKIFNSSSFFAMSFVKALNNRERCPIILVTNPPFLGIIGLLLKILRKRPYILIVHDLYPDIAVNAGYLDRRSPIVAIWNQLNKWIFREASFIVGLGRDVNKIIKKQLPTGTEDKVVYIPNWADPALIKPIDYNDNILIKSLGLTDKFIVQYSGNMGLTHDMETIVEAANLLKKHDMIHFLLIGDGGKRKKIERMIEAYQLKNVTMLDYQPRENLIYSLSASHVSLISLENSAKGLSVPSKLYGILASGRPAIAIVPEDSEVALTLNEYECGLVVAPKDVASLVESIYWLKDHEDERASMGMKAYHAFLQNFTVAQCADKYFDLIRKIS